jgi:Protein of unknown function (DUF1861).
MHCRMDLFLQKEVFMTLKEWKQKFEAERTPAETMALTFIGIDGFDVYNCSIPFTWNGKKYIYGRVEKRNEWANSWIRLFEETGKDTFTLVKNSMIYQLEDPYIAFVGDEMVMGGTHVHKSKGEIETIYGYFYRGTDLENLKYFTSGPKGMKDIRIVEMPDGIGVFSRPRIQSVTAEQQSASSLIGFAKINSLEELSAEIIENAKNIEGLFGNGEWGGCNQCYYLDSGMIGIIAHKSYSELDENGNLRLAVYMNTSFVFDPIAHKLVDEKIIATRTSYPKGPAKVPQLVDCTFTSGITPREDGKWDLYAGLSDVLEGRIVIDYPFEGFGKIVSKFSK